MKLKRKRPHSLPPLPNYNTIKPGADAELKKPYVIGAVAVIAVIMLGLLIFFSGQFVGKAYSVGGNTVDLVFSDNKVLVNLNLEPGVKTGAVYFELSTPGICGDIVVNNLLWNTFYETQCANDKFMFSDATFADTQFKGSQFTVAELSWASFTGTKEFNLEAIDVYTTGDAEDLFPGGQIFTLDVTPEEPEEEPTPSGGGGGCSPRWDCGTWTYCNKDLIQTRRCVDTRNCRQPKIEKQDCVMCDESWICSIWSKCVGNKQTRTCTDEHQCGTIAFKPDEIRSCTTGSSYVPPTIPPTQRPAPILPGVSEDSWWSSVWKDYKWFLIGIPLFLILLLIIILIIIFYVKPKKKAYNMKELEDWIEKERAMGTSDTDIRKILHQQTSWSDKEIDEAFEALEHPEKKPSYGGVKKPGMPGTISVRKPMAGKKGLFDKFEPKKPIAKPGINKFSAAKKPKLGPPIVKKPAVKSKLGAKKSVTKPKLAPPVTKPKKPVKKPAKVKKLAKKKK